MTGGAIIPAAKALGISRTTLWEKMKRYGLAGVDA
jgi:transcriptional regulator of acetoin/glycerol metabolism